MRVVATGRAKAALRVRVERGRRSRRPAPLEQVVKVQRRVAVDERIARVGRVEEAGSSACRHRIHRTRRHRTRRPP